ncbi:hypothetical protein ACFL96_14620 [Thermoproteota archaeon]
MNNYAQIDQDIYNILESIEGFVAYIKVDKNDIKQILELEQKAENLTAFGVIPAENQGVRNTLKRQIVFAVAYYSKFFSNFKDNLHNSSVIMTSGKDIVGEEITDMKKINELKNRNDTVIIGSSFVLYPNKIRKSTAEAKIVLPERSFLPLHSLSYAKKIISGSPSPPVDNYLKMKMNVNCNDPDIGTVLVGFKLK